MFEFLTSGSRGWAKHYSKKGAIFLRIGNLDYETTDLDLTNIQHVSPPRGTEGLRTRVEPGDLLVSITGDTGMVGIIPNDLGEAYINQHIALCRPVKSVVSSYAARTFMSPLVQGQLSTQERGIKNSLGLDDIRRLVVPLAPLAEQHRIVARVDELMTLLDRLEQQLADQARAHDAFAAAAVHGFAV